MKDRKDVYCCFKTFHDWNQTRCELAEVFETWASAEAWRLEPVNPWEHRYVMVREVNE